MSNPAHGEVFESSSDVEALVDALMRGASGGADRHTVNSMALERIEDFDVASEEFYDKLLEVQGYALEFESTGAVGAQRQGRETIIEAQQMIISLHGPASLLSSGGSNAHRNAVQAMQEYLDEARAKLETGKSPGPSGSAAGGCGSILAVMYLCALAAFVITVAR